MSRLLLMAIVAVMAFGVSGADVMAQRDAGAKARGDNTPFFGPTNRRSRSRTFYQPTRPRVERYRSFSYQPIDISAGDHVVVTGDNVKVMKGSDVVGDVPTGTKFQVTKVINGWLGTVVDVEGKKLNGWIWHRNVGADDELSRPIDTARDEEPAQIHRRFSYEPALIAPPRQRVERASQSRKGFSPEDRLHPGRKARR